MHTERRFTLSVRAEGSEHHPVLVGRAAVFNSRSKPIYTRAGSHFYERLAQGCFTRALQKGNTIANLHHDMTKPLGTVKAGTLQLTQDSQGLAVRCEINPEVSYARDAWHNAQSRNLSSMSFAFRVPESGDGEMWTKLMTMMMMKIHAASDSALSPTLMTCPTLHS